MAKKIVTDKVSVSCGFISLTMGNSQLPAGNALPTDPELVGQFLLGQVPGLSVLSQPFTEFRFHGLISFRVSAPWGKNPSPRAAYGLAPLPSKLSYPGERVRGLRPPCVRPWAHTSRRPRPSVPAFPSAGRPNQRPFFRRSAACSRAVFWS